MIFNPKNITNSTGLPKGHLRGIDYFQFVSAYFVNKEFEFTDTDDFKDIDTWAQAIKDRYIFPLHAIKQVTNESEETNYQTSKLKYKYKAYENKYAFAIDFITSIDYNTLLASFSGQDYSIIFVDANNYVYAYTPDGTKIKALTTNLIDFNKMLLSNQNGAFRTLRVELDDYTQLTEDGVIEKFDWKINSLEIIFVTISDVESSSSDNISFSVKDENFDCPIQGLSISDIELDDVSGTQTIGNLIEGDPGEYQLSSISPGITNGQIIIDTDSYYGTYTYTYTNANVSLENIIYISQTEVEFDVKLDIDSSLVTGLLIGDFTVTDDINGVLSIGAFSEVSTGRYNLSSLSGNMTTGDIDISNATYTGSDPYDVLIFVVCSNFADVDVSNSIKTSVTTFYGGVAVAGLGISDFSVIDGSNGSLTINSLNESPSGTYELTFNKARTGGTVTVSTSLYSGNGNYDYTIDGLFRNGGASDTTDWINPTDGLAEYWEQGTPLTYKDASIETGNGFTGNSQRVESLEDDPSGSILQTYAFYFKTNTEYKLKFDYRSDSFGGVEWEITTESINVNGLASYNIGNATSYTSSSFTTGASDQTLFIEFDLDKTTSIDAYLEIDNVRLEEV